jgi:hypothetical protein
VPGYFNPLHAVAGFNSNDYEFKRRSHFLRVTTYYSNFLTIFHC